jgi:HPt (histidine-containing phosphotransfer) domain-containing protein
LDEDILSQLTQLGDVAGEDLVGKLAVPFLEDADHHLSAMRKAVVASDMVALSRSAHMLCGSSANLGATELARLCAVYGSATGTDVPEDSDWFLPAVASELERVRMALAARMAVP